MCVLHIERQGVPNLLLLSRRELEVNGPVRATDIVNALIAETGLEDLADAFAWLKIELTTQQAPNLLPWIRQRDTLVYGYTRSHGVAPISTRAFNNEVAFMMIDTLRLAFDIRLTGLRAAAHLNGREGVLRSPDPANHERWGVSPGLWHGCECNGWKLCAPPWRGLQTHIAVTCEFTLLGGHG